jgi:hypothetical protein
LKVENKLKKMLRHYKVAVDWRNATGRGVEEGGGTIAGELNRRCARFADLDAIFGTRPNINPPPDRDAGAMVLGQERDAVMPGEEGDAVMPGEERDAAVAIPEDSLTVIDETSGQETSATSDSRRDRRRTSPATPSGQAKRGKTISYSAAFSDASDKRFALEGSRLEVQTTMLQARREDEGHRLVLEEKTYQLAAQKLKQEKEIAIQKLEQEKEIANQKHELEKEIANQKHTLAMRHAEERIMMLRLKLDKLDKS